MSYNKIGRNNAIDSSAQISENVIIGHYNKIGKNVIISGFKDQDNAEIRIGDCNIIHDNTRILIGENGLSIGDWNVFHNNMLVMGNGRIEIGHNCWFGQNTILDSTGGLFIHNGVRIGLYSQVWTHVASGELIEGCKLFAKRSTIIEDDAWLVGSCNVGSGVHIGNRAICMNGSLITKDIKANCVYRGSPARLVDGVSYYSNITLEEKMQMMLCWVKDFLANYQRASYSVSEDGLTIQINDTNGDVVIIGKASEDIVYHNSVTYFNVIDKTFRKKFTTLEMCFYKFIYDHKARFIPLN